MSTPFGGVNLRQQERKIMRVPAVLTLSDGNSWEARTLNVSDDGMGIVSSINPREGTPLTVTFRLPTDVASVAAMRISAEVRNSVLSGADSGFRIGLQFINVPASIVSKLRAFSK